MKLNEVFELFYFIGVSRRTEYEDSIVYDFMVDPVNVVVYSNEVLNEIKEQTGATEVELITRAGTTIIRFVFVKEKQNIPQEKQTKEPEKEPEPEKQEKRDEKNEKEEEKEIEI